MPHGTEGHGTSIARHLPGRKAFDRRYWCGWGEEANPDGRPGPNYQNLGPVERMVSDPRPAPDFPLFWTTSWLSRTNYVNRTVWTTLNYPLLRWNLYTKRCTIFVLFCFAFIAEKKKVAKEIRWIRFMRIFGKSCFLNVVACCKTLKIRITFLCWDKKRGALFVRATATKTSSLTANGGEFA